MRIRFSLYIMVALILTGAVSVFGASEDSLSAIIKFSGMYDASLVDTKGMRASMAGWVDTTGKGMPIVVFNPTSWTRTDCVDVQSPFSGQNTVVILIDDKGRKVFGQSQGDRLYFTAFDVPALGYKLYMARRSETPLKPAVSGKGPSIDNQFLSLRVNISDGTLTRMLDKRYKRQLLPWGSAGAVPQIVTPSQIKSLIGNTEVVLMESGPSRARVTFDHYYNTSQVNEDVIVYDNILRMDLVLTVDWQETQKDTKLRFAFPIPADLTKLQFGYPVGYVNTDIQDSVNVAHQWVDLSSKDWGLTVCSSLPILFEVSEGVLYAILTDAALRPAGTDAADAPELTLSFFPRKGNLGIEKFTRLGMQSTYPFQAVQAKPHKGKLAKSQSLISLTNPNTVVTHAEYNDDKNALHITVRNIGTKPSNTRLLTACKYSSWSIDNESIFPRPLNGEIDISLNAQTERTITLYR